MIKSKILYLLPLLVPLHVAACAGEPEGEGAEVEAAREQPGGQAAVPGGGEGREMARLTVPAGTSFQVRLEKELSTKISQEGDSFTVVTVEPLTAEAGGAVPAGARIHGTVTAVQHSEGAGQPAVIKVDFRGIEVGGETFPIYASLVEANPEVRSRTSTAEGAAKVGAATAAGAVIGRVIGGDAESTLIGAAAGAAAGTAIVLGTSDADAVLPADSRMTLRLDQPLEVETMRSVAAS